MKAITRLLPSLPSMLSLRRPLRASAPMLAAAGIVGAALVAALAPVAPAAAQAQVLNLYSARHYQTDEALYADFTRATGIRINRIEADDAGILARLQAEGSASPADVVLLVDAARLWRAEQQGLFQPVRSAVLDARIPKQFHGGPGTEGSHWFGLSTRARVIVYDKARFQPGQVDSYAKLADPALKGQVCLRSGSHPYNLSLFGSLLERTGPERTEAWLQGLVANLARQPRGGDTDQIRGVASGECGVALTNSYYFARLMRSNRPEDQRVIERVGLVFPDQAGAGTHVNIAGGGLARHAPNREAAVRFLEYLASDSAQRHFADGNNEFPVVASVKTENPALVALGSFRAETVPIAQVGANTARVQQMLDRAGLR